MHINILGEYIYVFTFHLNDIFGEYICLYFLLERYKFYIHFIQQMNESFKFSFTFVYKDFQNLVLTFWFVYLTIVQMCRDCNVLFLHVDTLSDACNKFFLIIQIFRQACYQFSITLLLYFMSQKILLKLNLYHEMYITKQKKCQKLYRSRINQGYTVRFFS